MPGPIPDLRFQPYNPMDTAIQTALGVYGAGMQGQQNKAETDIKKYMLANPYLLGGEQAKDIGSLMAMMGQNPGNMGQMITGAGNPYPMPNRNENQNNGMQSQSHTMAPSPYGNGQVEVEPMGNGPSNFQNPVMGQNPNMGMQRPSAPQMQMPGGQPFDMNQLIQDKIKFALTDPAGQQALIAEKSAQATLPYQAYLAGLQNEITTGGTKNVKKFDIGNEVLDNSAKISGSARQAESSINKFEKAMGQISPLLNAPVIGGLFSPETKANTSIPYKNAQQAANSLVLEWAPVMNQNGILTNDSLAMVQAAKLSPDSPKQVNEEIISIMAPASKRMQEMNPFMQFAIKDLNIDPREAQALWLQYNQDMPVDPFLGGSMENVGKFKDYLNSSRGIENTPKEIIPKRLGDKDMDQRMSGALSVDPELLAEMNRRGLIK